MWSDTCLGLRFGAMRRRVLVLNSKLWVSYAGAACVLQLTTMIDYINLQALGCRVRQRSRDRVAEDSLLRNARGNASRGTTIANGVSPSSSSTVTLPLFQSETPSVGRQEGQARCKQKATTPLQATSTSLAAHLTDGLAAPITRHTEGAPLVSREFTGAARACRVIGLRRDKNIVGRDGWRKEKRECTRVRDFPPCCRERTGCVRS